MYTDTHEQVISGKDLASAAFDDLESFFFLSSKFIVKKEFNSKISGSVEYVGSSSQARIKLSQDFCNFEHRDLNKYLFSLLIISHELAHYLNHHNSHKDQNKNDSIAIEARADNFGAQIFATIITFGKRTNKNIRKIDKNINQKILIENIGISLGELYSYFYQYRHPKYPHATHRVFSIIAGLLSFFNRYFDHLPEDWTMWFLLSILRNSGLPEKTNPQDAMQNSEDIINKIYSIHKKIQSIEPTMQSGMKPIFGLFLSSNFQQSQEERTAHKNRLTQMVEKFGIFNEHNITTR